VRAGLKIYFLSEQDEGQVTGGLTVLLTFKNTGTSKIAIWLKFSRNVCKSGLLILGDRGLVLVLALIILLVLEDI
jgi:hypothetical protein